MFLDTTPFHAAVGERIRWELFGDYLGGDDHRIARFLSLGC